MVATSNPPPPLDTSTNCACSVHAVYWGAWVEPVDPNVTSTAPCSVYHVCSKAYRSLNLIRRTISTNSPVNLKKQLYISLVRSHLCYCSQIWRPNLIKDITNIERIQRKATKFITPRACARGNVIGFVCRLSSVVCRLSVVSTKIARSGDLGI